MTAKELTRKLMLECTLSRLEYQEQAIALGTAYASYLTAQGFPPAALHNYLDMAIQAIEDHKHRIRGVE